MIRIEDLQFCYGRGDFVFRVRSLVIEHGAAVAIVGPSGSGKTTLLHLISGVLKPEYGRIEIDGRNLGDLEEAARRSLRIRRIGMVYQEFELLDYLSVLDNILLPCRISDALVLDGGLRQRAETLARRVGIGHRLHHRPRQLSHGERQRVGVCRALLNRPPLLLADEPTGNLDPANKGIVLDILLEAAAESGATLLTVTHDHELLARFTRVIDCNEFHRSEHRPEAGP